MSNTITHTGTQAKVTPEIILPTKYTIPSRTVVHEILNRTDPEFTLAPPSSRAGTLEIFAPTFADANAIVELHSAPGTVLWSSTDYPQVFSMHYVVVGDIAAEQSDVSVLRWVVRVGYRKVLA
jgi:hypothetical protein